MSVRELTDALATLQRLYIETASFIYYVEDHSKYSDKMERIFGEIDQLQIEIMTSVITLTETLTIPLRTGDKTVEQAYRMLLQATQNITLMPITVRTAERAANLRAQYNLRTPDALHVASAIEAGCDGFLTNDLTLRRITELRMLVLDELEI